MVHLHLHTKYSLLDSTLQIDDLIERLNELGMDSVAITDHGNMYGACELYKALKKCGKKLIIGCECYITEDRFGTERAYHLVLLAKNETGRLNLQRLVGESTKHKYRGKPRIDFELLRQHHDGLICLSACMAGEVSRALQENDESKAREIAKKYKTLFGDDYYIEYQSHGDPEQLNLNQRLVQLANELGIKFVVTCDCHYLSPIDQKYHSVFVQINQNRDVGETYRDCYVQSEQDVMSICESTIMYNSAAIATTHEIADKCSAEYPLSAPIIPHNTVPAPYKSEIEYLKKLCNDGYKLKGIDKLPPEQRAKYKQRARYELNAVEKMGFEGYYLLVYDYMRGVNRRGIARGSAGGSLLAYLMSIVDIDPIQYGLYFERFIDVGALDLLESGVITRAELKIPDIDVDISPNERKDVMDYIVSRYGQDNVVCLGQFSYIWAKGAIKDIGRVLNIPYEETNEMTSRLNDDTIEEALNSGVLDKYKDKYPELFECASKLSGLPKSFGVHPCGRVICTRDANYYNALEYSQDTDSWVLQGDMHTADDLGLVKIDLLALRTVDVIYDTLEMVGKQYNDVSPRNIDMKNHAVWDEFKRGNTNLIFQFESTGMRSVLRDMHCDNINDLGVANALYRPGSIQYISNYVNRKHGNEEVVYIHDDLKPILSSTYGIIVFQEQLIDIGRYAGLKNPDELRQATAKKKPKLMEKIEPEFKNGLLSKGWTETQTDNLWRDILKFAAYSFNKSHAYAYAITAYISMYLKVHHPVECMTAYINSYKGSSDGVVKSIVEAQRMGIRVCFDTWNKVLADTTCRDGVIYLGINTLSGFGDSVAEALQSITATDFESLATAIKESSITQKQFETLIKLGFFDEFGERGKLLKLLEIYQKVYSAKVFNKNKLPEGVDEETIRSCSRETAAQFRDIDNKKLFGILCLRVDCPPMPITEIIEAELVSKGYITHHDSRLSRHYLVLDMNTKYSPKMKLYDLATGEITMMKTYTNCYQEQPFSKGAIIKAIQIVQKPKSKKIDGKWCKMLDEKEPWITSYRVKSKVELGAEKKN